MEVTKREILFSVIIFAVMIIFGVFISDKIDDYNLSKNEEYYLALKVDNSEQFQYAKKTSVGNVLAYGEVSAESPVSMPEISGEYFYIEKVTERYNRHVEIETYKDSKGKTRTREKVTYSWDTENRDSEMTESFNFLGVNFENKLSSIPEVRADLDTVAVDKSKVRSNYIYNDGFFESVGDTREYFVVCNKDFPGTLEVNFSQDGVKNFDGGSQLKINSEKTIDEVISERESSSSIVLVVFWIAWVILSACAVVSFCYFDNRWLE